MQLRLSLTELDRRFAYISEGRTYHGEAVNPKGLSLWERMMGFSKVCLHPLKPTCLQPLSINPFRNTVAAADQWWRGTHALSSVRLWQLPEDSSASHLPEMALCMALISPAFVVTVPHEMCAGAEL